jgi:hypothetical protein
MQTLIYKLSFPSSLPPSAARALLSCVQRRFARPEAVDEEKERKKESRFTAKKPSLCLPRLSPPDEQSVGRWKTDRSEVYNFVIQCEEAAAKLLYLLYYSSGPKRIKNIKCCLTEWGRRIFVDWNLLFVVSAWNWASFALKSNTMTKQTRRGVFAALIKVFKLFLCSSLLLLLLLLLVICALPLSLSLELLCGGQGCQTNEILCG